MPLAGSRASWRGGIRWTSRSRVLRYSPGCEWRAPLNGVATVTRGALPDVGELLRYCTAINACVPGEGRKAESARALELR